MQIKITQPGQHLSFLPLVESRGRWRMLRSAELAYGSPRTRLIKSKCQNHLIQRAVGDVLLHCSVEKENISSNMTFSEPRIDTNKNKRISIHSRFLPDGLNSLLPKFLTSILFPMNPSYLLMPWWPSYYDNLIIFMSCLKLFTYDLE